MKSPFQMNQGQNSGPGESGIPAGQHNVGMEGQPPINPFSNITGIFNSQLGQMGIEYTKQSFH